jgi:putative MATE family efflux protein
MTGPLVVGILAILLFTLVDAFFVGRLGTGPLAALSFSFPVAMLILNFALGVGIGTTALLGFRLGNDDRPAARRMATHSLLLSITAGALVWIVGRATVEPLFSTLGAPPRLLPLIGDYMGVWYAGMVPLMLSMASNSCLRAAGDTRTPGLVMALAGVGNAILDPLLIFGWGPVPGLGLPGAALATVLAWSGAGALSLYLLAFHQRLLEGRLPRLGELLGTWGPHLRISVPAAASNMLMPLAVAALTALLAQHGPEAVAAFGVGGRIEALAIVVILALTSALPPLVSQSYGAGRLDRVRHALALSVRFVLAWELGVYALLAGGAPWIAAAFSDDPRVTELLTHFLWILPLSYGAQGVVILVATVLNALHHAGRAVVVGVVRLFVLYVPLGYVGGWWLGVEGVFAGAALGNFLAALGTGLWMRRFLRRGPVVAVSGG